MELAEQTSEIKQSKIECGCSSETVNIYILSFRCRNKCMALRVLWQLLITKSALITNQSYTENYTNIGSNGSTHGRFLQTRTRSKSAFGEV
jgi:hypothetical protein